MLSEFIIIISDSSQAESGYYEYDFSLAFSSFYFFFRVSVIKRCQGLVIKEVEDGEEEAEGKVAEKQQEEGKEKKEVSYSRKNI